EKVGKKAYCQRSPPRTAEELLFQQKSLELLGQMDQSYVEAINRDLQRSDPSKRWSMLTLAFYCRVKDHLQDGTPLAFPAAVAKAYVLNPDVNDTDVCRECDYRLPRGHFTLCPVCGRGSVCFNQIRAAEKSRLAEQSRLARQNALKTPK